MEFEGGGVDAVPHAGRRGTVVEHVPQVGTAVGAFDLGPRHKKTSILLLPHALRIDRRPETRPARLGVVFCPRCKELVSADDAKIDPGLVMGPVCSGEGSFGSFVDAHLVLQRRELLPELRLVELLHGVDASSDVLRFRLEADPKRADELVGARLLLSYICGAWGFCCHRAIRVPEWSSKTANHPWLGISFFGMTIFPPAFLIFSWYSSIEFTKM